MRNRSGKIALALATAAGLACASIFVEPGAAGPDYADQGEYAGPELGAQVIALGDGEFEAVLLAGGLPGAGWDGSSRTRAMGRRSGSEIVFSGRWWATLQGGELRGTSPEGESFVLTQVMRESPTLGAPAPPGATVLFDGSGPGDFDGKLDGEGNLAAGATSRSRAGSFELHLEFRTPFMPSYRGQRRGNSGVFLQNRYEIQVLDSFGLTGEDDECGALYGQKAPDVNMAFPPLRWQTYDVVFEAARFDAAGKRTQRARVSLRHNGVPVHDRVALSGPMDDGDPEGPEPGPLHLQSLWIPVAYRNVWIKPIEASR